MHKKVFYLLFIILLVLITFSCRDKEGSPGIDYKEQIDEYLPVAQWKIADKLHGGRFGRLSYIWNQYQAGIRGTYAQIDKYDVNYSYLDESWEHIFIGANYRLDMVSGFAYELNLPAYEGIAKILQAYLFSITTDVFDDIPFYDASEIYAGRKAEYDDQETVYEGINSLILDGISDLYKAIDTNSETPGPEVDYIYEGDLRKWIKAANVLRLRTTLKLSHQKQDYNLTLSYINQLDIFDSNFDNLYFPYTIHEDIPNPFYTFDNNIGNLRVGEKIVDLLKDTDDPRLPEFVKKNYNQEYLGSGPGKSNQQASYLGPGVASKTSPIYLITYAEQQFIKAEVYYRTGQKGNALDAYKNGVAASLEQYNVYDSDWLDENTDIEDITLEDIMNAKYIAMFLNPEAWADWRRTGYPQLDVAEGSVINDKHPRRFLYPRIEHQHNSSNVPQDVEITDRVWWDVK